MKTKLTPERALKVLTALLLHYPNSKHTLESLAVVADDMAQDMDYAGVSAEDFQAAVEECRRTVRYFPLTADILTAHRNRPPAPIEDRSGAEQYWSDRHPADANPTIAEIVRRARELRQRSARNRKQEPLSFREAFERAKREVEEEAAR